VRDRRRDNNYFSFYRRGSSPDHLPTPRQAHLGTSTPSPAALGAHTLGHQSRADRTRLLRRAASDSDVVVGRSCNDNIII